MKQLRVLPLVAWQGVRRRPLRNLLSALSLTIGILAIVLIRSGGDTIREAIVYDAKLDGGLPYSAALTIPDQNDPASAANRWRDLLARALSPQAGQTSIIGTLDSATPLFDGRPLPGLDLSLADGRLLNLRPFPVIRGHWLDTHETYAPQIVVNNHTWAQLGGRPGTVELSLGSTRIHAILRGVIYDGVKASTAYLNTTGQGPWRPLLDAQTRYAVAFYAPAWTETDARTRIAELAARAGLPAGQVRRTDHLSDFDSQLQLVQRVFLAVAALSLVVGALGILNIGLSTLRERSDELALRRSFGATRLHVVIIMIVESQIVALTAGALGISAVAIGLPYAVNAFTDPYQQIDTAFPWTGAALGLAAGSFAALTGSITPALRAARVPIASIMRV